MQSPPNALQVINIIRLDDGRWEWTLVANRPTADRQGYAICPIKAVTEVLEYLMCSEQVLT